MGYSIIFETKIVLLSDGRILHLSRSGCNNDTAGRKRCEFVGKVYTREEFEKGARSFMENSAPHTEEAPCFDLKIGSRIASYYDYGEHLLRMLKRAKPYSEFLKERYFFAEMCVGIEIIEPVMQTVSLREFDDKYHAWLGEGKTVSWRRIMEYPNTEDEALVVRLLEKGRPIEFTVGKKHKH